MLKRMSSLILAAGTCLALAGPMFAFQDQSAGQGQDKMSSSKMEGHHKMKKSKKHKKDKMDKTDKMDKMN